MELRLWYHGVVAINACKKYKARLMFFDNIYSIGGDHINHITGSSRISPASEKGGIGAKIDSQRPNHNIKRRTIGRVIPAQHKPKWEQTECRTK